MIDFGFAPLESGLLGTPDPSSRIDPSSRVKK
jgi:hypothetical protein